MFLNQMKPERPPSTGTRGMAEGAGHMMLTIVAWSGLMGTLTGAAETPPLPPPPVPLSRVIALAPNAAEIICSLGACDTLVGVSRFCTHPPELRDVPKIGGLRDPDLETVLALKPDLVVLRGQSGPLRKLCVQRNIPVYDDQVESLGDLYRTISDLGQLLNRPSRAKEMVEQIKAELAKITARVKNRPRPRVLFTLRSPNALSNVITASKGTFVSELIEIAGGKNVFADGTSLYPSVSLEEIVARDPEVIIEVMTSDTIDDKKREKLLHQWDALEPISAVRNHRVHFVTDGYITIPSDRVILTARTLAAMIHPEQARDK